MGSGSKPRPNCASNLVVTIALQGSWAIAPDAPARPQPGRARHFEQALRSEWRPAQSGSDHSIPNVRIYSERKTGPRSVRRGQPAVVELEVLLVEVIPPTGHVFDDQGS